MSRFTPAHQGREGLLQPRLVKSWTSSPAFSYNRTSEVSLPKNQAFGQIETNLEWIHHAAGNSDMEKIYFLHGKEGSPEGQKSQFLKQHLPGVVIPALDSDLAKRQELLHRLILEPALLVGSSLGGLSALLFAQEKPALVRALVLVAPAVGLLDESLLSKKEIKLLGQTQVPPGLDCAILAAQRDHLIPLQAIQALIQRSPEPERISLRVLPDDHSMNQASSHQALLEAILKILEKKAT